MLGMALGIMGGCIPEAAIIICTVPDIKLE